MKRVLLSLTIILAIGITAHAQPKFYLNGFGGYTFDESFSVGGFSGKLEEAAHYGGSLEFVVRGISTTYHERTVELTYQGQSTMLNGWAYSAIPPAGYKPSISDVTVSYMTIGMNNYVGKSRKAMGFGGLHIGAGWLNNKDNNQSETKFAANFKAGGRFMFTDNIGLKLYAQVNTIVGGIGGGFYFGTGGVGAGVSTYSSVTQFGLGGGLTIGLGGSAPVTRTTPQ